MEGGKKITWIMHSIKMGFTLKVQQSDRKCALLIKVTRKQDTKARN